MLVVYASLIASACAYAPLGDGDKPVAVRVADRWAVRNIPGFASERSRLTAYVEDRGPDWLVIYAAAPGVWSGAPQVIVSKATGRIVRVEYGQ